MKGEENLTAQKWTRKCATGIAEREEGTVLGTCWQRRI